MFIFAIVDKVIHALYKCEESAFSSQKAHVHSSLSPLESARLICRFVKM